MVDARLEREPPHRSGFLPVVVPEEAGTVVSATVFNGLLIVACENGLFYLDDGEFKPIKMASGRENLHNDPSLMCRK